MTIILKSQEGEMVVVGGVLIWTGQKGQDLKWTRKEQRSLIISFCVVTQKVKMHSLQGHDGSF